MEGRHITPTRALLRQMETFGRRVVVGVAVAGDTSKSRQDAVRNVAKKFVLSERYVWGTAKLGREILASATGLFEKEVTRKERVKPRVRAGVLLFNELRHGPKPATEIEALARKAGVAERTLRRECKRLGVKKQRFGGRGGCWVWELSADTKKYFGIKA